VLAIGGLVFRRAIYASYLDWLHRIVAVLHKKVDIAPVRQSFKRIWRYIQVHGRPEWILIARYSDTVDIHLAILTARERQSRTKRNDIPALFHA